MSGRRKRNSKSSQIKGLPSMLKKKWGSMVIGYKGILHFGNSAWKSGKISLGGSKDRNIAKHESHVYQPTCSTPFGEERSRKQWKVWNISQDFT